MTVGCYVSSEQEAAFLTSDFLHVVQGLRCPEVLSGKVIEATPRNAHAFPQEESLKPSLTARWLCTPVSESWFAAQCQAHLAAGRRDVLQPELKASKKL